MFALRIINKKTKIEENVSLGISYLIERTKSTGETLIRAQGSVFYNKLIMDNDFMYYDYYIVTENGNTYTKLKPLNVE